MGDAAGEQAQALHLPGLVQGLLGLAALDDAPQPVHEEGELLDVLLFVGVRLVPDAHHRHDLAAAEEGHAHEPGEGRVAFGPTLHQGVRHREVVAQDRPPLAHHLAPEARVLQLVGRHRVHDRAGRHDLPGPGVEGELLGALVIEVDVANGTAGEGDRLVQAVVEDLPDAGAFYLVQADQGAEPVRVLLDLGLAGPQGLLDSPEVGDIDHAAHRALDVPAGFPERRGGAHELPDRAVREGLVQRQALDPLPEQGGLLHGHLLRLQLLALPEQAEVTRLLPGGGGLRVVRPGGHAQERLSGGIAADDCAQGIFSDPEGHRRGSHDGLQLVRLGHGAAGRLALSGDLVGLGPEEAPDEEDPGQHQPRDEQAQDLVGQQPSGHAGLGQLHQHIQSAGGHEHQRQGEQDPGERLPGGAVDVDSEARRGDLQRHRQQDDREVQQGSLPLRPYRQPGRA